jgi:hypothetical protein
MNGLSGVNVHFCGKAKGEISSDFPFNLSGMFKRANKLFIIFRSVKVFNLILFSDTDKANSRSAMALWTAC